MRIRKESLSVKRSSLIVLINLNSILLPSEYTIVTQEIGFVIRCHKKIA